MDTLYSWNAKRAGGRITITHSCGKIPHIDTVQPEKILTEKRGALNAKTLAWAIVATASDGRKYVLHVPSEQAGL